MFTGWLAGAIGELLRAAILERKIAQLATLRRTTVTSTETIGCPSNLPGPAREGVAQLLGDTSDLEIPAQDVAHQLGHTDGGELVQRLYGHPSERLARERIKRATAGKPSVVSLTDAEPGKP